MRPISVLNGMRRWLERIVPDMINRNLSNIDPDNQFVFIVGQSNMCAIESAVKYAQSAIFHESIATEVSI